MSYLCMFVGVLLVDQSEDDGGDLEEGDDNNEKSVGCQEDSGLLDGSAIAKETDDKDKRSGGDENVRTLFNHGGLCQFLENQIFL